MRVIIIVIISFICPTRALNDRRGQHYVPQLNTSIIRYTREQFFFHASSTFYQLHCFFVRSFFFMYSYNILYYWTIRDTSNYLTLLGRDDNGHPLQPLLSDRLCEINLWYFSRSLVVVLVVALLIIKRTISLIVIKFRIMARSLTLWCGFFCFFCLSFF